MPGLLRRQLRLGLGGLMLAILALALWMGYKVHKARAFLRAVAAVKAEGGWVRYADEFVMGPVNVPQGNAMFEPAWGTFAPRRGSVVTERLRRWIGDEYFREIVHVSNFVDIQNGSSHPPDPYHSPLNDTLRGLESQKSIRTLQLGGDTLTEEGLASIAKLTDLRELFVWWGGGVTDAGIARIGRLPRLQQVNIHNSALTDAGVGHLADLAALEKLKVHGKRFTDASLAHLRRAKRLKWLVLKSDRMEITDAGLDHLAGLKDLRQLSLEGAKLTPEGKAKLIKAIPGLKITP